MTLETVVTETPDVLYESCTDNITEEETNLLTSDAYIKPRVIFTDGFGGGPIQSIGFSVPLESITQPATDPATIRDPFNDLPGREISPLTALSRYSVWSGDTHPITIGAPLTDDIDGLNFFGLYEDWEYQATGGRGKGCIISRANGTIRPGGHWRYIPMKTQNTERFAGIVLGMDLQGITIPDDGISCISFVINPTFNLADNEIASPYFGIIPSLVVTINPNRTIKIQRLDIDTEPGTPPDYFGTGTWTTLDTSTFIVPPSGIFALEAGMFTSTRFTLDVSPQSVANGFAYVRLYTPNIPFGVTAIRKLNTNAHTSNARFINGIAYGSDTRGEFGDGIGNVTFGIPGIKFDSVVVYDNHGTKRGYLYNSIVGTSYPLTPISVESAPFGSGSVENIARNLNDLDTLETKYNLYTSDNKDLYIPEPAKAEAKQIVALSAFKYGSVTVGTDSFAGKGAIIIGVDDTLVESILQLSEASINIAGEILVLEENPVTEAPFEPEEIGDSVRIGWRNAKTVSTHGDTNLYQLGLEYVYREQIVNVTEPSSPIPVASFGYIETVTIGSYDFQDTSIKYDGPIVSNHWDWGDGSTSDNVGGQWSGVENAHHVHAFLTPGTFVVTLTVTASDGTIGVITHNVVVPNQLPSAGFTYEQAPASLTVDFTDASTDIDGTIVSRLWDFDDSSTSIATNPSHTYLAPGDYTVTLTVTDNSGGVDVSTHIITVPVASAGCGLSALALADTLNVQGDDFAGGNPPLPNYANTAAFKLIIDGTGPLGQREAYGSPNFGPNVGDAEYAIDTVNTFNGRNTLKIAYGAGLGGAGWLCNIADDAYPGAETDIPSVAQWARVIFAADSGILSGPAATAFSGVEIISIYGFKQTSLMIRGGRIMQDDQPGATFSYDLGPESLFVGRVGYGEAIVRFVTDSIGHTLDMRYWIGDACSLAGASPISSKSYSGVAGANLKNDTVSFFGCNFSPSGAAKYVHCSLWETMPTSVSANPYGVSLI